MTPEEKAKTYDNAIEKSKDFYVQCKQCGAKDTAEFLESIFPELKESEDERIRKELLEHCKNMAEPYIQTGNEFPQIQSWIDWLEKQGEIIDEYEDKLDRCACENFDKGYKAALEEQGEQNPTLPTWSEEDERMINSIIKNLDEAEWFDIYQTDWLRSLKERVQPQPKREWSEEDSETMSLAIDILGYCESHCKELSNPSDDIEKVISWLESLKERLKGE